MKVKTPKIDATLQSVLKDLHLPTVRSLYIERSVIAERESLGYKAYLLDVRRQSKLD